MNANTLSAIGTRTKPYTEFLFECPDNNLPECERLSSEQIAQLNIKEPKSELEQKLQI